MSSHVLVTGGSRNIGAAICKRLVQDGYKVLNFDKVMPDSSSTAEFFEVDLSDERATANALAHVGNRYVLTRLVNSVGVVKPAFLEDTKIDDFRAVMDLNVRTAIQCTQALLPQMRRHKFGRIVSISSRAALGKPLRTSYAASKAALHGLTRTWALEMAGDGITVNCVAPGTIETPTFYMNNPPEDPRTKAIIAAIPAGRIGLPDDVANATAFFMDPRSSFVNGQVLYVCGGLTVGLSS